MHGSLHLPLLDDLWNLISLGAALFEATHAISIGYSMEGFGVWQLPASSPSVFDIAISVAGYGIGTYKHNRSPFCGAPPQPMSSEVLDRFVETYATKIAKVSIVFVVHARHDQVSYFADAERIANAVSDADGHVEMLVVPDDKADSDYKRRRSHGHAYFNYTLLDDESEEFLLELAASSSFIIAPCAVMPAVRRVANPVLGTP